MISAIFQLAGPIAALLLVLALLYAIKVISSNPFRRGNDRADAELRAEQMLESQLSPEEYQQLQTQGHLRVVSPGFPGRTYLVPRYRGLVRVFEQGKSVMRLCVGPVENVPDADVVLMHKLMIEGNEEEYLKTANVF